MAAATVTSTTYGYRVTGGVDNTLVSNGKLRVKSLLFFPATGANTVAITDKNANAIMTIKGDATAGIETQIWVDSFVEGMYADLTGTGDVLLVFLE